MNYINTSDIEVSITLTCAEINRLIKWLDNCRDFIEASDDMKNELWMMDDNIAQLKSIYNAAGIQLGYNSTMMTETYDV
jgi:hypothetical protein